jgi:hypothetical protein
LDNSMPVDQIQKIIEDTYAELLQHAAKKEKK